MSATVRVIDAKASSVETGLRETWESRELLRLFAARSIMQRYRQMVLGMAWAVVEPLALLLMMTIMFGYVLRAPSGDVPYPVFAFSGLTAWLLFSRAAVSSAGSLADNMGLISKVYFPRLILPLSVTAREIFDSLLGFLCLLIIAIAFGYLPSWRIVMLPLLIALCVLAALAIGLWCACLLVRFRDVRPMLTIGLQVGMYASPVAYSASIVPERIRFYYELNPMYWAVEFARWIFLAKPFEVTLPYYISMAALAGVLLSGFYVFQRLQQMTVDVQ